MHRVTIECFEECSQIGSKWIWGMSWGGIEMMNGVLRQQMRIRTNTCTHNGSHQQHDWCLSWSTHIGKVLIHQSDCSPQCLQQKCHSSKQETPSAMRSASWVTCKHPLKAPRTMLMKSFFSLCPQSRSAKSSQDLLSMLTFSLNEVHSWDSATLHDYISHINKMELKVKWPRQTHFNEGKATLRTYIRQAWT